MTRRPRLAYKNFKTFVNYFDLITNWLLSSSFSAVPKNVTLRTHFLVSMTEVQERWRGFAHNTREAAEPVLALIRCESEWDPTQPVGSGARRGAGDGTRGEERRGERESQICPG